MEFQNALLAVVLVLQVIILLSMRGDVLRRAEWRLSRLDRKMDIVIRHLGLQFEDKAAEMVRPLLLAGKKVDAVKEYRRITGAALNDAKQAIDAIELEQPQSAAERG